MKLKLLIIFSGYTFIASAQNLEQIGKTPLLRFNGGISSNGIFYDGTANRDPFTYFVNGNLNFNISGIYNIPLSFSYTNQDFGYSTPFKINRLSIHPSYKWVATHIGDVSMTFSPYTLNGHQFTGGGVDLSPNGPFKISALYGRFLKATEYDEEIPEAIPAYERYGFGLKTAYDLGGASIGLIFFTAKDRENSLQNSIPIEVEITPKENTVVSAETNFTLFKKAKINLEYAISGVTEDTRISESNMSSAGFFSFLMTENVTTNYYNAFNLKMDYPAGNGSVGMGYERIDPDYRTFGAYYFNNDLENITVNASQNIIDNKVSISVNAGLQKDNLDNTKSSELQRIVSAFNVAYNGSEKLSINAGYSNFQSYTNIRDQFDFINEVNQFENIDTLNYRQISQNANLGVNYTLKKTESQQQAVTINLTYQNSNNKQGEETVENGVSNFYNITSGYILGYPKNALNFSFAANISYNTVGVTKNLTLGPTLTATKSFFDKKLRTNFSSSYNTAYTNDEKQNDIYNLRLGGNYTLYESHNFTLNLLSLFRKSKAGNNTDFTATLGYSYSFDTFKIKFKKRNRELMDDDKISRLGILQFRYRSTTYSGTIPEITEQLTNVKNSARFQNIPQEKQGDLTLLFTDVKNQTKPELYKEKVFVFLDALYSYEDFLKAYDTILHEVIQSLREDMQYIDFKLERSFVKTKIKLDDLKKEKPLNGKEIDKLEKELNNRQKKLVGHRWMKKKMDTYTNILSVTNPDELISEFKKREAKNAYKLYEEEDGVKKIKSYLESQIIDFYYHKSLEEVNPDKFELRYIDKI
ncbi:hypothetical protein [Aquimarina aquimarini]|uniref:hypothetical protein n=1 Tax=Aquimarina aquimarini TaxID=1191734 RepID=UPI000D55F435|nr:hypothetical protein [Aquimarina aquimarini]